MSGVRVRTVFGWVTGDRLSLWAGKNWGLVCLHAALHSAPRTVDSRKMRCAAVLYSMNFIHRKMSTASLKITISSRITGQFTELSMLDKEK